MDVGDIAFDASGALWAIGSRLYRLPAGSEAWEEVADITGFHIFPLGPDTLLRSSGFTHRSVDGGQTWEWVWVEGGALFETDRSGPNDGLLLSGARQSEPDSAGLGYSTDRGATWHRADFTLPGAWNREAHAFLELPAGHAHAGRLIAVGVGGFSYSDDGGRLWQPSNVWADLQAAGYVLALGPGGTAYAWGGDGFGTYGVWASADGAVWAQQSILPRLSALLVLGSGPAAGSLVGVAEYEEEGPGVYASEDGGWTWALLGRVPEDSAAATGTRRAKDAVLGPDGRLYVAADRSGPAKEWVYRTTDPVVTVVTEGRPGLTESALRVWPNPARGVLHVEAEAGSEVVLYDVLGRAVLRARLATGITEAGVSGLAPGVYIVRVGGQAAVVTVGR